MKKLIIIAGLSAFLFATGSRANDLDNLCNDIGDTTEAVVKARDTGMSRSKAMSVIESGAKGYKPALTIGYAIVNSVYDNPRVTAAQARSVTVESCYEAFGDKK